MTKSLPTTTREKPPLSATKEKPLQSNETPAQQKIKINKLKKQTNQRTNEDALAKKKNKKKTVAQKCWYDWEDNAFPIAHSFIHSLNKYLLKTIMG